MSQAIRRVNSNLLHSSFSPRTNITMFKSAGLRSVRSIPSLRAAKSNSDFRAIHNSARSTKPTNLLNSGGANSYMSLSLNALKTECKNKGLKISGRKAQLIDRLTGHDASKSMTGGFQSAPANSIKTSKVSQAKGDDSSIDFFVFKRDGYDPPAPAPQMKIPVPPDSHIGVAPEVEAPKYATPVPDGGAADDPNTKQFSKVISLGSDSAVRTLVDDTQQQVSEKIIKDETHVAEGPTSRDNTFVAAFVAAVSGWWLLGKSKSKDKKNQ